MLRELEPLATSTGAYVFVVVLGLIWGSFANVCIYRWPPTEDHPKGRSVVAPGSHCFVCKTPIRWYDNTPLLSWLWLRGRCRSCQAPFSARYLIVEAISGVMFGFAWWATVSVGTYFEPFDVRLLRFAIYAAFGFVMIVVTFIDLDHKLILNKLTIPSVVVFYALGVTLPERAWHTGLIGAAVGYGLPWTIGEIYYRITKREGLGLGDSMLLAVIGALLGWKGVVFALFGGSVVGSVVGISALLAARRAAADDLEPAVGPNGPGEGREPGDVDGTQQDGEDPEPEDGEPSLMRTELPFGPFLALAAVFYLFAEPWILLNFRLPGA